MDDIWLGIGKEIETMENEHYEIWVTLERWNGDSKLEDVETCKIGNVIDEDGARQLFDASQTMSMAIRPFIDLNVKVYDEHCPFCKSYFDFNNGPEEPQKGDELECEDCGKTFLLG